MKAGRASRTALRVAIRRAAHQMIDDPRILDDPIAVRLIGPGYENDLERAKHTVARDFRLFMVSRSRYAEDHLADALAHGAKQYVVLGAGLDTFAYRNPFAGVRVFEVDFPRRRSNGSARCLALRRFRCRRILRLFRWILNTGLWLMVCATRGSMRTCLHSSAGLGWFLISHSMAFRSTLTTIGRLPEGSGVSFDYVFPPHTLSLKRRLVFEALSARVAAAGEPFKLFITREELELELRAAGFRRMEQVDSGGLNARLLSGARRRA